MKGLRHCHFTVNIINLINYVDVNHLKIKIIRTPESARNVPNNWYRVGILARKTALKIVPKTAWVCKMALVGPPRPLTQAFKPIRPVNVINVPAIKLIPKLYQVYEGWPIMM